MRAEMTTSYRTVVRRAPSLGGGPSGAGTSVASAAAAVTPVEEP